MTTPTNPPAKDWEAMQREALKMTREGVDDQAYQLGREMDLRDAAADALVRFAPPDRPVSGWEAWRSPWRGGGFRALGGNCIGREMKMVAFFP